MRPIQEGRPVAGATLMSARMPYVDPPSRHYIGKMDVECQICGALHWMEERLTQSSLSNPTFGSCCKHGEVALPEPLDPPPFLHFLFTSNERQALEFRSNIRQYNAAFAFTSLGIDFDDTPNLMRNGNSVYSFRIGGELYHSIGTLAPATARPASYAQLYIHDPVEALRTRGNRNRNLRMDTMSRLQEMLNEHHFYAHVFRHAHEVMTAEQSEDVSMRLCVDACQDRRRFNLPTSDEIAAVLPGDGSQVTQSRDIILRSRDGPLHRMSEGHPAYAPLHYVMLFPRGEDGWSFDSRLLQPQNNQPSRMTQTRYFAYQMHERRNHFNIVLRGGRLFQQYAVDAWASAEQSRLTFLVQNQNKIRATLYSGLQDALQETDDVDLNELGQRTILPSSYQGSPRHMYQIFQDAMCLARYHRKIDLFITMTANPRWPEVLEALLPGQKPEDRPDIVARVFNMKKKALLKDIYENGVFGRTAAYIYTIEFQKRGLPHMHLLIFLAHPHKIMSAEEVDAVVSAVWPDPISQPLLFDTVKSFMIHGPCGPADMRAPCMEDGKCTKRYPKDFHESTVLEEQGYPKYRRPDDGRRFNVKGFELDNRWVVPHNPFLTSKYNCHINVEVAASFATLKYIAKYIHKHQEKPP